MEICSAKFLLCLDMDLEKTETESPFTWVKTEGDLYDLPQLNL